MKLTAKAVCLVIMAVMCFNLAVYASAAKTAVIDGASLMSDGERQTLNRLAEDFTAKHNIDIAIAADDSQKISPRLAAEEFYIKNGMADDGILLYINMTERDIYILTSGVCKEYFNDRDISALLDKIAEGMIGDASGYSSMPFIGGEVFLREADIHIDGYGKKNIGEIAGIAVIFGLLAGAVGVLVMVALHKRSLPAPPHADAYLSPRGFRLTRQQDRFLHTRTIRTPLPKSNSGGGYRGGGGRSFGGGGRKF